MSHDHDDHHDHEHDHSRTFAPDHTEPTSEAARTGLALRELLIEGGWYSAADEQAMISRMQGAGPENGARLVARAWVDDEFRQRLLADGSSAIRELGFDLAPAEFTVMENSPTQHHVLVCTLCSCYPRALLGMSPSWYKSRAYRSRIVREPRQVLAEFGVELEPGVAVRVHDSTAELRYMVLPERPDYAADWSESRLAQIVTRDSMIGTQRHLAAPKGS